MAEPTTADARLADEGSLLRQIGRVYAEALLGVAEQRDQAVAVGDELTALVNDVFRRAPELELALTSPVLRTTAKRPMLEAAFKGKVSDTVYSLLVVLNDRGRFAVLRHVAAAYQALLDTRAKRVRVRVRSAVALTQDQQDTLRATLAGNLSRDPVLDLSVDPELLGGLVVQVGDEVFDGSVRTRIDTIRNQLLARSSHVASLR